MIPVVNKTRIPEASNITSLVDYLLKDKQNEYRIEDSWSVNCQSEDVEWSKKEMEFVASQNTRAEKGKAYHLIISFQNGERPDAETLKDITKNYAEVLGFGEHQYICVSHGDTENFHVHMAISRIHPTTLRTHSPYDDYDKVAIMAQALEIKHGLGKDNHSFKKDVSASVAQAMERAGGKESLIGYIQRSCTNEIQTAMSWQDLHCELAKKDIRIVRRANGLVFMSQSTGVPCKASSVDRAFSLNQLEKKLGSYQEANRETEKIKPSMEYKVQPLGITTAKGLSDEFKLEKERRTETTRILRDEAWDAKLIAEAKITLRYDLQIESFQRDLKNPFLSRGYKAHAYKRISNLRKNKQDELKKIRAEHKNRSKEIIDQNPQIKWLDWLAQKATDGNKEALAFLAKRKTKQNTKKESIEGTEEKTPFENRLLNNVSKKGTIFHSKGLRESKDDVTFSKATDDELANGLKIAISRFGNKIEVNGDESFRKRIAQVSVKANLDCSFTDDYTQTYRDQLKNRVEREAKIREENDKKTNDAKQYIEARNEQRKKVESIKEHIYHDVSYEQKKGTFQGIRSCNNTKLALLEFDNKILVIPQSSYAAKRIAESGIKVGQQVEIGKQGKISALQGSEAKKGVGRN